MPKTVLIVDDNAFVRHGLRNVFERERDFEICGEAANGRDAIEAVARLQPELVILDLSMPVMNGLDAAKVLKAHKPSLPLILYSAVIDRAIEVHARAMGISEVVSKSEPVSMLIRKARKLVFRAAA